VRAGRWSLLHDRDAAPVTAPSTERIEFVARQLLARYGVVFRALIEREKLPVPWRDLARCYRLAELRGDVRGGRFVQRFSGEQYALPEAVELMRRLRRGGKLEGRVDAEPTSGRELPGTHVAAGDPLNLEGVLTPSARVSAQARRKVLVG
jgi:ATP-dependent Lhr-like helicase